MVGAAGCPVELQRSPMVGDRSLVVAAPPGDEAQTMLRLGEQGVVLAERALPPGTTSSISVGDTRVPR